MDGVQLAIVYNNTWHVVVSITDQTNFLCKKKSKYRPSSLASFTAFFKRYYTKDELIWRHTVKAVCRKCFKELDRMVPSLSDRIQIILGEK